MGTRGAYGFKSQNKIKVIYNHFDSYPSGLGEDVVNFIQRVDHNLEGLKSHVDKMKAIPKHLKEKTSSSIMDSKVFESPDTFLDSVQLGLIELFPSAEDFLEDALFCEYSYIINLDNKTLECYMKGKFLVVSFPLAKIPKNWQKIFDDKVKNPDTTLAINKNLTDSLVNKHKFSTKVIEKVMGTKPKKGSI